MWPFSSRRGVMEKIREALGWTLRAKDDLNNAIDIIAEYVKKTAKGCYWDDFVKFKEALWHVASANSNLCEVKGLIEEVLKSEGDEE